MSVRRATAQAAVAASRPPRRRLIWGAGLLPLMWLLSYICQSFRPAP